MTDLIRNTAAPDGIHERVEFNEYAPRGGWYAYNRRIKKIKSVGYAALFLFIYAVASTAIFYI